MKTKREQLSRDNQNKLLNILASRHTHSEMQLWAACKECQEKFAKYKQEKAKMPLEEKYKMEQRILEVARKLYENQKSMMALQQTQTINKQIL